MNHYQYKKCGDNGKLLMIHPSAKIGKNCTMGINVIIEEDVVIGDDCFFAHNVLIRSGAKIGNKVQLRAFVHVDPGAEIGDYTHVFPYGLVGGWWKIGSHVWYGPYSVTTNSSRPKVISPASIGDYSIIYSGCMIGPDVTMGIGSVLGMGSVLTKSIPDFEMWYGNPAKFQRKVEKENLFADAEEWEGLVKRSWIERNDL